MIKTSGNTLLLALAADQHESPARAIERIARIIPTYLKDWFEDNIELHTNGNRFVIMLSNYQQSKKILCGVIAAYLQDVCISEGCNAYDERLFIKIIDELHPRSIDSGVLNLLKQKVESHLKYAESGFGGNALFHRQGNTVVVGQCFNDN
jgi:hypothetical protein